MTEQQKDWLETFKAYRGWDAESYLRKFNAYGFGPVVYDEEGNNLFQAPKYYSKFMLGNFQWFAFITGQRPMAEWDTYVQEQRDAGLTHVNELVLQARETAYRNLWGQ